MIKKRRNTIAYVSAPAVPSDSSGGKNINSAQEETLMKIVLKYFDVIENKKTDTSLNPAQKERKLQEAWQLIRDEFHEETNVST